MNYMIVSKIILFAILFDLSFLSCTNDNNIKESVEAIMGRELEYPIGYKPNSQYSVINYVDSIGCTSCKLRVHQWLSFIDEIKENGVDLEVVFVSHPNVYTDVCELIGNIDSPNISIVKDAEENWIKRNNLPEGFLFQTLLVDDKRQVIVVGNPTMNDEIKRIMKKSLIKKVSKS